MIRVFFYFFLIITFISSNLFAADTKINKPDNNKLYSLLQQRKYSELDLQLKNFQKAYEGDFLQEDNVYMAFYTFNRLNSSFENYFNEWVTKNPNSYSAYLARGMFYRNIGAKKRGTKFINETTKEQLDGMEFYYKKALYDFQKAIEINPKLIWAYCYIIDISKNFGQEDMNKSLMTKALQINPHSLLVRWFYLLSLLPRWGGSLEKMENFIKEAKPHYSKNPKLKILEGRLDAEKADQLSISKKYEEALHFYNQALKHGEHYYYNRQKGKVLVKLKRYKEAINAFDKSLQERPYDTETLLSRGYSYLMSGDCQKAIADFDLVIEIDPDDSYAQSYRKDAYSRLKR